MRTKNSIKNIIITFVGQMLNVLVVFISRKIFIHFLGADYLGINGLFTNVLSVLSLAELGIGSAIIYSLYKPIAEHDNNKISALMYFYKKAYRIIGIIVLFLGIAVFPFLDFIIKDKPNIQHVNFYFFLFLADTVISYFFAYRRSLIIANQKQYIVTSCHYAQMILLNIIQSLILIITRNFLIFLVVKIVCTFLENIIVSKIANKMYPEIEYSNKHKIDSTTKNELSKNIKAIVIHKSGDVVVNSADNILISSLIGIYYVGMYSNYYLIIFAITGIIWQIFNSITASVGNLNALESKEKTHKMYRNILFLNFWIIVFCSISFFVLANNFIQLWLGKEFLLATVTVLILAINFYFTAIRRTTITFRDSLGIFYKDRYKTCVEAIIKITISIILAKACGILGIFIGTLISTILVPFWVEPYVLYKYGFEEKAKEYFILFAKYTIIAILSGIITWLACGAFVSVSWVTLFVKAGICVIIPNIIFLLVFYKTDEFKYFVSVVKHIIFKGKEIEAG